MADMSVTKIPNLSVDSLDGSSGVSVPSFNVASTASMTVGGIAAFTGAESHSGAVTFSGAVTSTATLNTQAAKTLSKQTTASLTSATLADGEFAVGAVSATSCMIYFRSGVTTYRFLAASAAVL